MSRHAHNRGEPTRVTRSGPRLGNPGFSKGIMRRCKLCPKLRHRVLRWTDHALLTERLSPGLESSAKIRHKNVMFAAGAEISCSKPASNSRPIRANSDLLRRRSKG